MSRAGLMSERGLFAYHPARFALNPVLVEQSLVIVRPLLTRDFDFMEERRGTAALDLVSLLRWVTLRKQNESVPALEKRQGLLDAGQILDRHHAHASTERKNRLSIGCGRRFPHHFL